MTYHEKHVAVRAAERVHAVRAVADDIEVKAPSLHERSDAEIAEEIANLRERHPESPDSVGVQVRDGRVILHGEVNSPSERAAIESAARQLTDVHAVADLIEVKTQSEPTVTEVERRVQDAIARTADLDPGAIRVTMNNGTVLLQGRLPSLAALQTAVHAAETAPGVTAVESEIVVTIREDRSLHARRS